jgi:hypothetical protein
MKVSILINEHQQKQLIVESLTDKFKEIIMTNKELISKIVKSASKQINFDLSILLTFSTSVGGFIEPLNQFINGEYPEITPMQASLILTGVIFQYIKDNQEPLKRIMKKIKEEGLEKKFKIILSKGELLKDTFLNFLESLNLNIQKTSNLMGYTFLIPIIPIVYNAINNGLITDDNTMELVKRLSAFIGFNYGGITIKELVTALINRFRER